MKITVWTDTHKFATNEWHEQPWPHHAEDPNCYLIGDIVDLANCKKSEVDVVKMHYKLLTTWFGDRYIDGNHERVSITNKLIFAGSAVLCHGDFESWGPEKAIAYRSKPHGASFLKRGIVVNAIEAFERVWQRKFKEEFIERARLVLKETGQKKYVCGHLHPKTWIQIGLDEGQVIILPRGKTELIV